MHRAVVVIATGAVLLVLALAISSLLLMRDIVHPLNMVGGIAQRIADGDVSEGINSDGQPEEMRKVLLALHNMQDSLVRVVRDVRQGSNGVAIASTEIAHGNQDLSDRTEQQSQALQETNSSMRQLSATVSGNAENARTANQLALNASTVAQQGGEVVSRVVETMKGINESSKKFPTSSA